MGGGSPKIPMEGWGGPNEGGVPTGRSQCKHMGGVPKITTGGWGSLWRGPNGAGGSQISPWGGPTVSLGGVEMSLCPPFPPQVEFHLCISVGGAVTSCTHR